MYGYLKGRQRNRFFCFFLLNQFKDSFFPVSTCLGYPPSQTLFHAQASGYVREQGQLDNLFGGPVFFFSMLIVNSGTYANGPFAKNKNVKGVPGPVLLNKWEPFQFLVRCRRCETANCFRCACVGKSATSEAFWWKK